MADHYVVGVFDEHAAAYDADPRRWRRLPGDGDKRLFYLQPRTVQVDDSADVIVLIQHDLMRTLFKRVLAGAAQVCRF